MTLRTKTPFTIALAFVACAFPVACGLIGQSNRCDFRPKTPQCTDFRDTNAAYEVSQRALCATLNAAAGEGTFTGDATCDTTDMWGGCRTNAADGTKQTNWYYKSDKYKTIDDAKKECDSGMSWVDPQ